MQTSWFPLLLILNHPSRAHALNITGNYSSVVLPLTYQSKDIPWTDWVSLFTLCLAPLIAHIIAGVPQPSFLGPRRPSWHECICQYNPTSILWRYLAIADRRLRTRNWAAADMAAANAHFWTARGWDGSDAMAAASRLHAVKLPAHAHVELFSATTLKSLIVTVQGAQAVYQLVSGLWGGVFSGTLAIDSIFGPLAVFGLLRLCAAAWLTEDFVYSRVEHQQQQPQATDGVCKGDGSAAEEMEPFAVESCITTSMSLLEPLYLSAPSLIRPATDWRSWLFRVLYLFPILFLCAVCAFYILPGKNQNAATTTTFLLSLFYFFFLLATALIYLYYFVRARTATTIIPCISSLWYKVYTTILLSLMLVLIVVASLETRKTPCGRYTTWPTASGMDQQLCHGLYPVISNSSVAPFGLATRNPETQSGTTILGPGQFRLVDFEGFCQGKFGASRVAATVAVNGSSSS